MPVGEIDINYHFSFMSKKIKAQRLNDMPKALKLVWDKGKMRAYVLFFFSKVMLLLLIAVGLNLGLNIFANFINLKISVKPL